MQAKIRYIPDDLMSSLNEASATQSGKCFENCVIAVLGMSTTRKLRYILGFVTPPGYSQIPHAWIGQETEHGLVYLDPTLQPSSLLWQRRMSEFKYEELHSFTKEQLLKWIQENYSDRKHTDIGLPEGAIRGPILTAGGELK